MIRASLILLAVTVAVTVFAVRTFAWLIVFAVRLVGAILRAFSRLTTTTSVRVSPGTFR